MRVEKGKMFKVCSAASGDQVKDIADVVNSKYGVVMVKAPQKTLAMVKVRESIKNSLFYLGEVLACECMVEIGGVRGAAVTAGDDFDKVTAMAVLDAAVNANLPEKEEILHRIEQLEEQQQAKRSVMNAQLMKSKVAFSVMNEG